MDLLIAANTVTQPNSDIAPATGTPGWATDGDPTTNTQATQAPAWHYNMMMAEMLAIVKAAGITPSNADWSQVLKAMQTIFAPAQRGVAPYSATLAQLIGGYPKYAIVVDAVGVLWRSSADANMTVPGADGAKWGLLFEGLATQEWADSRYQELLNFTPVQQGGGSGQGPNKVILGWATDGSGLKCQVDGTDEGFFLFRGETQCFAFSSMSYNTSTVLASLTFLPKYNGYLKLDYNLGQDSSNPVQNISVSGSGFSLIGSCDNNSGTNLRVGSALYGVTAGEQVVLNMTGSYTASSGHTALGGTAIYVPR
ncbi:hypothetical protein NKW53_12135 [Acetobacter orientalis]|uniref:hypothetical protein n=1 Tax=Acetobacter orientalis TaxID=146474 RepID=UPI0020A1EDDD|nr:hypothetical protein [Acetobacter orientalis]MCP1216815.1 hypothetical protein [Acetobacter orientalis]MCP1219542.1 hypothetical protein [Acetobacter orientalis]